LKRLEEEFGRLPNSGLQPKLEALMFELKEHEIPGVVALVRKAGNPGALGAVGRALFARWAEVDPRAAANEADTLAHYDLRGGALSGAMTTWFATDSPAALRHLEQIPVVREKSGFGMDMWSSIELWVKRDPRAALEEASATLVHPIARKRIIGKMLRAWADTDLDATIQWPRSVEDPAQSLEVVKSLVSEISDTLPEKAVLLALTLDDVSEIKGKISIAMMRWAESDPPAATGAYFELPSELRSDVAQMTAHAITRNDLEAALRIAARLPEGREHDAWILSSANELAKSDPVAAASLTESLSADLDYSPTVLRTIAERWLREDPEPARAWIRDSKHFDATTQRELLGENQ
jgi:hypothetical protein